MSESGTGMAQQRIAVIGAGPAGLACAQALVAAGQRPTLLEKSRGIGGRLATRRRDGLHFDHGAPAVSASTQAGQAWLAQAVAAGAAAPAPEGIGTVGMPGMSALCRPLAEGLSILTGTEVTAARREGAGWRLEVDGQGLPFDRVVAAIPAPQAARLFGTEAPEVGVALAPVRLAPCYTLMAAFETAPDWPAHLPEPGAPFDLIVNDSAKPGRPPGACWVAHASEAWSVANLERERPDACEALLAALAALMGPLPPLRLAMAHRWRHARTAEPLGQPFAASADATLLAGGDWALGPRAEHAVLSGSAMARALLAQPV